jgi:3-(3-hydroxy-phenyl)propionate hydroxylase
VIDDGPSAVISSSGKARTGHDVIVIGYGPVGQMLALKLGQRGYRVLVLERQPAPYPLPRAAHLDDETARILQSVGAGPQALTHALEPYDDFYEMRNAEGTTLLRLDWSGAGPSGWNVSNFFHQPSLESHLDGLVAGLPHVSVLRGHTAVGHEDLGDRVRIHVVDLHGDVQTFEAQYVVGADGANSLVRDWVGGPVEDLGYFHDWLVVDVVPSAPLRIAPPALQHCDAARPTTLVPSGPGRRRFEFMRLPGELPEDLDSEAATWGLLAEWGMTPATAVLERRALYTFQAKRCLNWQRNRVLIAGDAAHLMPPFAGQGMCSGLRDAVNLEWKLHLVLAGRADRRILESYGPERSEHVRHFITMSMALGDIICMTDPLLAAERDARLVADLASGAAPPPPPRPRLGDGMHRGEHGGTLSIQAPVTGPGGAALFDDATAGGGTLLVRSPELLDAVGDRHVRGLSAAGFQTVALADRPGERQVVDHSGAYEKWFSDLDACAVLIRPDFYLWDSADSADQVADLCAGFLAELSSRDG